jgi:hypothetical protein
MKKFIFLDKLKYDKAIKGNDKLIGLKQNLAEFEEKILEKLFQKREPTNQFRFILKKQNQHSRQDLSKPQYFDDLKRL